MPPLAPSSSAGTATNKARPEGARPMAALRPSAARIRRRFCFTLDVAQAAFHLPARFLEGFVCESRRNAKELGDLDPERRDDLSLRLSEHRDRGRSGGVRRAFRPSLDPSGQLLRSVSDGTPPLFALLGDHAEAARAQCCPWELRSAQRRASLPSCCARGGRTKSRSFEPSVTYDRGSCGRGGRGPRSSRRARRTPSPSPAAWPGRSA